MELKGRKVQHKVFGEGVVKSQQGDYISIQFKEGLKEFPFPGNFFQFFTVADEKLEQNIQLLVDDQEEQDRLQQEEDQARIDLRRKRIATSQARQRGGSRMRATGNVAFKCTFCDGGSTDQRLGFLGACSDKNIRQNIRKDQRVWCSSEDSDCRAWLEGRIDRIALDEVFESGGYVCYESALLRDWAFAAGVYHSGKRKGTPMKLAQVSPGSLCALTTRLPDTREDERQVFGVFLVDESYQGDGQEAGYVTAHSEYRLELTKEESRSIPFWRYHRNDSQPEKALWSSGLHRYFDSRQAALMLKDIAAIKEGKPDEALAKALFQHYLELHHIDRAELGEPNGALTLKKGA